MPVTGAPRGVLLLGFGAFAMGMDAYVMTGLLAGIGRDLGVSLARAGQCVTVFTVCYAVSAPLLSAALARLSTRTVLVTALLVFTAANAAAALAPSYPVLMLSRAAAGVGAGLYSPTAATAAAALASEDKRGRALATVLGGMSGGTVLGVPLGLLLAGAHGWRASMWLVTALGAAACAGMATRLPPVRTRAAPTLRARLSGLARPGIAVVVLVTFLQGVASLGSYTYLQPVLAAGGHTGNPAPYLWVWGIGGVLGSLLSGAVADRLGRPALLSGALLGLLGAALATVPASGAPPGLVLPALAVWGATGWGFVVPQQHRLLRADAPGGAAVALNSSATYLGSSVGAALGGAALAAGIGPGRLPLFAALVAVAGLLLNVVSMRLPVSPAAACSEPADAAAPPKGSPL